MERHHLGVTRNALRENRLVIFGLCSIGLRRHGPFISCHIFLPLCFALSGTHLGSSFFFAIFRLEHLYSRNVMKLQVKVVPLAVLAGKALSVAGSEEYMVNCAWCGMIVYRH